MCKILLSINPEYVEAIFNGSKRYEFRKVRCRKEVDKIIIYSTAPVMKIVGESDVLEILEDKPEAIWKVTANYSGIDKDFFDSYYEGRDRAVAYRLENVKKYREPLELADFGLNFAPQSFIYV